MDHIVWIGLLTLPAHDASISNPCECHKLQWPLLDFQPRQSAPDEIRDRRAHKPLGSFPHPTTSFALPLLPASREICVSLPETPFSWVGWWLPLNNETGNFLCSGNVPLVIHVILISGPQCSQERPSVLWTRGVSLQNVFFTFSSALNSKHDLYEWNSIRSAPQFPSGEIKVAQAKSIFSISRR